MTFACKYLSFGIDSTPLTKFSYPPAVLDKELAIRNKDMLDNITAIITLIISDIR
jgi:hypothetical protein